VDVTPRAVEGDGAPPLKRRRNPIVYVVAVLVVAAIGFVLFQGLNNAALYYRNADEAVADKASLGTKRFRVQGDVGNDVRTTGTEVTFSISFNGATVPVHHKGDPPELFKAGVPVVLEGHWDASGEFFASDTILIKHSAEYKEQNPSRVSDAPE
jgi:cytochrome c-type biogenesis protein CcmE